MLRAGVFLFCATLIPFSDPIQAGEKIRISTNLTEQIELPKDTAPWRPELPGGFRSIPSGGAGQGPILPPPNQPVVVRDPKFEELLDRKKNWMFDSPDRVDRDQAIDQILGVRKYDFDGGLDKRPRGVVQQFLEGTQEKSARNSPSSSRFTTDPMGREALTSRPGFDPAGRMTNHEELQSPEGPGIIPELNPAPLFNWDQAPEGLSPLGTPGNGSSIFSRQNDEPVFSQRTSADPSRSVSPVDREFNRIWEPQRGAATRFNDPINDSTDATRAIMNPISARKPAVPAPGLGQSPAKESSYALGTATLPGSTRSDLFGPARGPFGTPAYKQPTPVPVSTPVMQPKPPVLEIPRPKF